MHGLTTPSFVWDGLAKELADLGYRVLVYDLYGRGYSDRPKGKQTETFFLRQLNELLAAQEVEDTFTVFGYSMGGAIATCFAAAHPERVRELVLLAPAGVRTPKLGWRARLGLWPLVGDWMMRLVYPAMHRKGTEEERNLPTTVPNIVDLQQRELDYQGFTPAVLSSFRGILSENLEPHHRKIAKERIPVLAVLGADDPLIPPSVAGPLVEWHRLARVEVVEGAGHGLPYTHTAEVAEHLRDFLRNRPE